MADEDKKVDDTKTNTLDYEGVKTLLTELLNTQAADQNIVMTDAIKGAVKEQIEDAVREIGVTDKSKILGDQDDPKGGFKGMGDFAAQIYAAGRGGTSPSETLKAWNDGVLSRSAGSPSQNVTVPEDGAFLVPTEISTEVLTRLSERLNIMDKAMVIPMGTNSIGIPYIQGFNESQGFVAGNVQFVWEQEEAQGDTKNVKIGKVQLQLRKAMALAFVSGEMMKFSPVSAGAMLTKSMSDAMAFELTKSFFRGTGAGQPLGVLNAPATISVAKETDQVADTIVFENILKMDSRVYGDLGEWYANRDTSPQLGAMSLAVGAGGGPVFVNGSAAGVPFKTLQGAPLTYTSAASTLGDVGDIGMYDWSQYLIGQEAGGLNMDVQTSMHLKFDYDQNAFRFIFYVDGQPWWPSPFSPENGNTKSPYVTLAARA